jgi:hypothetical protein
MNLRGLFSFNLPLYHEKAPTALSGLIGTLAIFFIATGIGKLIKRSAPLEKKLDQGPKI